MGKNKIKQKVSDMPVEKKQQILETQLDRHNKIIKDSEELISFLKLQNSFKITKREFDEKQRKYNEQIRPFNQKAEDSQDGKNMETAELNIKDSKEHIKMLTEQLKNILIPIKSENKSYTG